MFRDRLPTLLLVVAAILALGAVAATLDSGHLPTGQAGNGGSVPTPKPANGSLPATHGQPGTGMWHLPLWLVAGVFTVAVGGGLAFVFIRTSGGTALDSVEMEEPVEEESVDLNHVGAAAGTAAERIDTHADVSNEVYRAWSEMVRYLNVPDTQTTTPEEFATHAIAAGMATDDVDALTQLFEEVRYGERDPDEREEHAVAILQRIEASYAADDTPASNGGGGE